MIFKIDGMAHKIGMHGHVYYRLMGEWYRSSKTIRDVRAHWYRQCSVIASNNSKRSQLRAIAREAAANGEWMRQTPEEFLDFSVETICISSLR